MAVVQEDAGDAAGAGVQILRKYLGIVELAGLFLHNSVQGDPSGLAQGFVDLDFGCSTILIGQ